MDTSVFQDKNKIPVEEDLRNSLAKTAGYWKSICDDVLQKYPGAIIEWNFANKYGWSCRIKDKKRAILYLLPRDKFFKVAFVFGQKAYDEILNSGVAESIKTELKSARIYAEGRGLRISVTDLQLIADIKILTNIKLKY